MLRQWIGAEDQVKASALEVGQVDKTPIRRRRLEQGDTVSFLFVVFELIKVKEIAGIVTAAKDYVTASRIVTEGTKHF
jgi:hypothetical protein